MKKILFPILMILFVIFGAVAADFLKSSSSESGSDEAHASDKEDKKDGKEKGDKKDKGEDGGDSYDDKDVSFLKFKRQFVVPVMTQGKIEALVIMNLNVELNSDAPDNAYVFEPKLRDTLTRELLSLSNRGVFGKDLTTAESYEDIRRTLLSAIQITMPEGVQDILILDIARQEQ